MPLFRPAEVGSNPKEGRVALNVPNPPDSSVWWWLEFWW